MYSMFYRLMINMIGIGFAGMVFKDVNIQSFTTLLVSGIVLSLLNVLLKPMLIFMTLPLHIFTFGLFYFFINAFIIKITASIVDGFAVNGLFTAVSVGVLVGLVNFTFDIFFFNKKIRISIWNQKR